MADARFHVGFIVELADQAFGDLFHIDIDGVLDGDIDLGCGISEMVRAALGYRGPMRRLDGFSS